MIDIKYPPEEEIEKCRKTVVSAAVSKRKIRRPGLKTVFKSCGPSGFVSFLIYILLWLMCAGLRNQSPVEAGIAVLGIYPLSYFAFSFLSVFSEEQCEIIELKSAMRFPYFYIIALRALYASVAAVFLNLIIALFIFRDFSGVWNLCAAGTAFTVILAVFGIKIYQKFGKSAAICIIPAVWTGISALLLRSGAGSVIFNIIIEIIPLAVHILIAAASVAGILIYVGKVEFKYADCR